MVPSSSMLPCLVRHAMSSTPVKMAGSTSFTPAGVQAFGLWTEKDNLAGTTWNLQLNALCTLPMSSKPVKIAGSSSFKPEVVVCRHVTAGVKRK